MRPVVDGAITVTLDQTRQAMRLLAEKARAIAEGAGVRPSQPRLPATRARGRSFALVGGNIDLRKFCSLVTG